MQKNGFSFDKEATPTHLIHTRTTEKNDENDAEQNKVLKDSSPNALISDPLSFC
jgi:hypothetical protein